MRKKTISNFFDNAMWYLIYLLPLVIFVGVSVRTGTYSSFSSVFNSIGLEILTDNVVLTNLSAIFGAGGVFPLFDNPDILVYMSYFISVFIIHLAVDVLLFIPRLAHKYMDIFVSEGGVLR